MPFSKKISFFYSLVNEAVVTAAHHGEETVARRIFASYQMLFDLMPISLFGLQEDPSQLFPDTCVTRCARKYKWRQRKSRSETGERLKYNNIQGICHRPHRDGDILRDPSGEAHQVSCWDSFSHPFLIFPSEQLCIVRSDRAACSSSVSSLIDSTFPSYT